MIKISCDNDKELMSTAEMRVVGFRGKIEISGDKEVIESQLTTILLNLMKSSPELFETAMANAIKDLANDKSD